MQVRLTRGLVSPQMQRVKRLSLDHPPDYPLGSTFVSRLKSTLEAEDCTAATSLIRGHLKHVDTTIELANDDWMKDPTARLPPLVLMGLWSLEYKRELTNPLCITASRGYRDCLQYLLECGARVNAAPGGKTALHQACENGHTDCVELLLEHRANPNLLGEDGLASLHLCNTTQSFRCAKLLLKHGAVVNQASQDDLEMPLHVAAKGGLDNHVHLYLRYGAKVDSTNSLRETPLNAACARAHSPEDKEAYLHVCKLLIIYGADVNTMDEEKKSPLHKACRNANHSLVNLLLENMVDVNAIDYNGTSPMACVLQTANLKHEMKPHRTVQSLLNYGSHRVWPAAFLKVLKSCASAPKTIEILFNSYCQIPVTEKWVDAVPEEAFQLHLPFYESLFMLASTPRSLQHLCRYTIRKRFGERCHSAIPQLAVPKFIQSYLLLEPEGAVH
uniref:Ankyrin repeat and SOCS box containing 18 n=2 Tax=Latimeria chalumnae TaxID=7897 RepID=H3A564_LATCH|nr:PREDICTED: ankyrin repeat and SOCS box protein 18 [Latimeria chalumnae]|eukprot:XP_014345845.1 PREDICTED: ankyrin repeat and SOCS box protein 18 [Latimeria chalumnae]